jgi:hypothetical protein
MLVCVLQYMLGLMSYKQFLFRPIWKQCCNVIKVEIVVESSPKNAIIKPRSEKQVHLVGFLVHDEFLQED